MLKCRLLSLVVLLVLLVSNHVIPTYAETDVPDTSSEKLSTPQLIDRAYEGGELTAAQRILYLAYALYEYESLPARFHSNVGWSGTWVVREVQQAAQGRRGSLPSAVEVELSRLMAPTAATVCDREDMASHIESDHFHVNYNTIGGGLTIADYLASLEGSFDQLVTTYDWAEPPLLASNPWGKYPVQVDNLGAGLYGYVMVGMGAGSYTGFIGDNPNTPVVESDALASCMVLNSNYSPFGSAQVALDATTAHEYTHSIQYGYGDPFPYEDAMWYESTATYAEDEVYDYANDNYLYLWPSLTQSLGESNDYYANWIFFRYAAEKNGGTNVAGGGEDVIQQFFANVAQGQQQFIAFDNALGTKGTNLKDTFHNFAIATKFSKSCTGGYIGLYCYEEGAGYVAAAGNMPNQGSIGSAPGNFVGSVRDNYAVNYVALPAAGGPYSAILTNTSGGGALRGSIVCDTGTALTVVPFPAVVTSTQNTVIGNFDPAGCNSVVAVITNESQTSGNPTSASLRSYTLALAEPTAVALAGFTATARDDGVLLEWETHSELYNLGFNLYRAATSAAPETRLNSTLIASQAPGSSEGARYEWLDTTAVVGTHYYWLEAVDTSGTVERFGPVSATVQVPTGILLGEVGAAPPTAPWGLLVSLGLSVLAGGWMLRRR